MNDEFSSDPKPSYEGNANVFPWLIAEATKPPPLWNMVRIDERRRQVIPDEERKARRREYERRQNEAKKAERAARRAEQQQAEGVGTQAKPQQSNGPISNNWTSK